MLRLGRRRHGGRVPGSSAAAAVCRVAPAGLDRRAPAALPGERPPSGRGARNRRRAAPEGGALPHRVGRGPRGRRGGGPRGAGGPRSALPGPGHRQPGEPCEGGRGTGAEAAPPAGVADVSRQGEERGGRKPDAAFGQPECAADGGTGQRGAAAAPAGRCPAGGGSAGGPVPGGGPADPRAAEADALGARGGIPPGGDLQPRRGPARGDAGLRHRHGHAGPGVSRRAPGAL